MQLIWNEFLKIIKAEAGSQVVETWFKAVTLEIWDAATQTVTLKMPNQFVSKWILQNYQELLKIHLGRLLHSNSIKIAVMHGIAPVQGGRTIMPASVMARPVLDTGAMYASGMASTSSALVKPTHGKSLVASRGNAPADRSGRESCFYGINTEYVFDNFIVGPSNSLAHAAAFAICENLGRVYNPLFIYGGTGLGKTHLMHAIGNEVVRRYGSSLNIRYETVDRFISEFISCIRFDRSHQFRSKYQKVDLLLLDDVQFLSNKEQTQETFFHIFNVLYEQQKQIVLTSDTFPRDIHGLQSRLRSRMDGGLVADIQTPDLETKIAILNKKAAHQNIVLPDDVADFIASRVRSNIRELEGALVRVSAFSSLTKQPINLELVRRVLVNVQEKKREGIMLETVLKAVARHFDASVHEVKSKKRHKDIAFVRQVTFYMMKKMTGHSLQVIGSFVGGRDHSTVIHAVSKVEHLLSTDAMFAQDIKNIEQKIFSE